MVMWRRPDNVNENEVAYGIHGLPRRDLIGIISYLLENGCCPYTYYYDMFFDNSTKVRFPMPLGHTRSEKDHDGDAHAMFPLIARFNHSCSPNATLPIESDSLSPIARIVAKVDITAGDEIFFCYEDNFEAMTRDERCAKLAFDCKCSACKEDPGYTPNVTEVIAITPELSESDKRRRLVRTLRYLVNDTDLDGELDTSDKPLIRIPYLKIAAERRNILWSTHFICTFMTAVYMEKEGLMDPPQYGATTRKLIDLRDAFRDEKNRNTAWEALDHDDLREGLKISLRLLGRNDPVDPPESEAALQSSIFVEQYGSYFNHD